MPSNLSRVRQWLAASKVRSANNALWQAIEALIEEVNTLQAAVNAGSAGGGSTTIINTLGGIIGPPGADGEDGADGNIGPIGIPGVKGDIGAGGPAGPTTIGPMGIDGMDGEDGYPLPGPQGILGSQGIQGPVGPVTIGPMGLNGEDGEDSWFNIVQNASGIANAGWELIAEQVAAGAANYDFIDLEDYNEIRVVVSAVVSSAGVEITMLISINNGSTFESGSGDYINIGINGGATNTTNLRFYNSGAAVAKYGQITIFNFNTTAPKVAISHMDANLYMRFIPTSSPLNAVRVRVTSGVISSGTIYVYGR